MLLKRGCHERFRKKSSCCDQNSAARVSSFLRGARDAPESWSGTGDFARVKDKDVNKRGITKGDKKNMRTNLLKVDAKRLNEGPMRVLTESCERGLVAGRVLSSHVVHEKYSLE